MEDMLGNCRHRYKVWFYLSFNVLMMVFANVAQASDDAGKLNLTVMFDTQPIAAVAVIRTLQDEQYVMQSNDGKMKQTPFDMALKAGKYALYVRATIDVNGKDSPFQVRMQTKAIPIEIAAGGQLEKTVIIPAGELHISADPGEKESTDRLLNISGASTFEGEIPGFQNISTSQGRLHLPVNIRVPPGTYHYQIQGIGKYKDKKGDLKVKADKTLTKVIHFRDQPTGFLNIHIIRDGKPVSPADYQNLHVSVKSHNGEEIIPFTGNDVDSMSLPVGVYDVVLPVQATGGKKQLLSDIQIEQGRTTARNITIPHPGTLNIKARWTHQPTNISDCIHYYNLLNADHLGALMGGHSVSRGKCFSDTVVLAAEISWARQDGDGVTRIEQLKSGSITSTSLGGRIKNSEPVSTIQLVPGAYDITVWPVGNQALQQTLKNVVISPGGILQKQLEFRWPAEKNYN